MDIPKEILLVSGVTSIFIITVFLMIVATGIIMLVLVHQKRQVQYFREKEQLKVTFEKEILETQLEIQEQTFKNISQEIHDNIGQVLSLVKLNINTMNYDEPKALQDKITDSKHLITTAIQDLRDLSKSLNTDYVTEMGLTRSIQYELEMMQRTGSYEIKLDIKGNPYRLEDQQELIFFRIVQEALHNIIRHAKATTISVELMFEPEVFTLKITDNGVGFDSSQLPINNYKGLGLGIRNMRSRASMTNTDFKLISNVEKGTAVILTLPLQTPKL
jgi:signal transduction histidine kinase